MWLRVLKLSLRYWYVYLLALVLAGLAGVLYYVFTPKTYTVLATLMVRSSETTSRSAQDELLRMMGYGDEKITGDEIEILSSRYLMEQVVRQLDIQTLTEVRTLRFWQTQYPNPDLTVSYDSLPSEGTTILVKPHGDGYRVKVKTGYFESSTADVASLDEPIETHIGAIRLTAHKPLKGRKYRLSTPTMPSRVASLCRSIHIGRIAKESKGIRLITATTTPDLSTDVLAALIEAYNMQAADDKNLIADNTARFIDRRLTIITASLDSVEMAIQDYKARYHIADLDKTADLYMRTNTSYDQMRREIEMQLDVLDFIGSFVSDPANNGSLIPANLGIQDGTLNDLISTYNARMLEFIYLSRSAKEENPLYIRLREQIEVLRSNILLSVGNVRSALLIRRSNLSSSGTAYSDRLESMPEQERGYMELLRRKRVIEQSYLYLTNRREENNLLQSSYALPARTVDPPQANPIADSPRLSRIGIAAIFFGLAIPFCIFLLIVILRDPNFVTRFQNLDISK